MFTAYYAAVLTMWNLLAGYARTGRLADGSAMPAAMKTEILVRIPIVQALVTQGRALDSTDFQAHIRIIAQLQQQQDAFNALATRYAVLTAVSAATTPVWTQLERDWTMLKEQDPEMANLLAQNVPALTNPFIAGGIGVVGGIALAIAALIGLKYLTK